METIGLAYWVAVMEAALAEIRKITDPLPGNPPTDPKPADGPPPPPPPPIGT